jgi:cytochrome P450
MTPALHSSWWSKTSPEKYDILQVIFTLSAISALLWYAWTFLKSKNQSSAPLPPGPKGLPLLGNLFGLDSELHSYFASLSQTYGPILKLQLGSKVGIVVSSASLAREMLKDHDVTFANHVVTTAGRIMTYGGCDILWTPYGAEWRMLRKVCVQNMLSKTTLDSFSILRRREVRQTVSYFYSNVGSPVNFGEQIFVTVLNVITNMMWGGTVDGKEKASLGAEFKDVVSEMTYIAGKLNISDFYPSLARFDLQGIAKQSKVLTRRLDAIFERMIDQRRKLERMNIGQRGKLGESEDGEKVKDFLEFLLRLIDEQDDKTPTPLTLNNLKALFMDMVVAGSDTSSNTMEFAMTEIMNQPKVMSQIQQELDAVVGKHNTVEESHIHQLPYLEAVVKETLRLHTPVPLLVPRYPSETCTVGGYTIPKGSQIFINSWAIHRDPTKWENPLKFDPERFLNNNNKLDYSGSDFSYLPFGSGRRMCVGAGLAERMVLYSLATLLHSFDWEVPPGEKLDFSDKFGVILKKEISLVAIPTPRLSDPALYT